MAVRWRLSASSSCSVPGDSCTRTSGTTPAGRYSFGGAAVVGCSVFYYGGEVGDWPIQYSNELIHYEADPATCTVTTVATGTCNKQCDKIVADVEEIRNGTNVMIKFKLRHPGKV